MSDLINRADAIKTVHKYFVKEIDKTPHEIDEYGDDVYTDMPTVNSLLACNKELSKALKALPSAEAKGDLISRQWLLELYGDYIGDNGEPKYHVPLEVVRQNIKDAPSAEAVQGEWKPFDLTWGRNVYFCTACQESTEVPTVNGQPSYNFCPNCGAKMTKGGGAE